MFFAYNYLDVTNCHRIRNQDFSGSCVFGELQSAVDFRYLVHTDTPQQPLELRPGAEGADLWAAALQGWTVEGFSPLGHRG